MVNLKEQGRYLGDRLLAQLYSLVDGNQASAAELQEQALRCADCTIELLVDWRFEARTELQTLAGDAAVDGAHCGRDRDAFDRLTALRSHQARDNHDLRERFTQRLGDEQQDALLWAEHPQTAWDFGQHSVCRQCRPCNGSGQVSCHGCGGGGRVRCAGCGGRGSTTQTRTVNSHGTHTRQETYSQPCNGCFGSGQVRCNTCGGGGLLRCDSCSGHGFFTDLMHITAVAVAQVEVYTISALPAKPLREHLVLMGCAYAAKNFSFEAQPSRLTPQDTLQVQFACQTHLLELDFSLRNSTFMVAAAGDEPLAFIRPPIFDLIFKEELQALQSLTHVKTGLKLHKRKAIAFFKTYRGQAVLDRALQAVAKIPYKARDTEQVGRAVAVACQGYVSQTAARSLGQCMGYMVDKVSPAFSTFVWCAAAALGIGIGFFAAAIGMERSQPTGWSWVLAIVQGLLNAVLWMLLLSPLACFFSAFVSFFQRRFIPPAYRQGPRNWQPLPDAIAACVVAAVLGSGYGWLSSSGVLPAMGGAPQRWISAQWAAHAPKLSEFTQSVSGLWSKPRDAMPVTAPPTQSELVRAVQLALKKKGHPDLQVDGQMGPDTASLIAAYRKKYKLPNASSLQQVWAHMQSQNAD